MSRTESSALDAPIQARANVRRLRDFVRAFSTLLDASPDESVILARGARLLAALVTQDDWLPDAYAAPHPDRYQQYLLYCDVRERFSIVSFVWAGGQATPIHDHTVWGLIGQLRGAELNQGYVRQPSGRVTSTGPRTRLDPGSVTAVSPTLGDLHRVENAYADQTSISIHVYGANIGAVRRATYDEATGTPKPFVSGYANQTLPNLWSDS